MQARSPEFHRDKSLGGGGGGGVLFGVSERGCVM